MAQKEIVLMSEKKNPVVLVTGGSAGIGASVAERYARTGALVVVTGRREDALRAVARETGATYVVADVGVPADAARAVAEVQKRHGRLDVLVNNAGIAPVAPLDHATPEHVRKIFDTNVGGLIETARAALPLLRASKGAIVNVTSTVADRPFANMSVYSASKAAVLALTRAWAKELAPDGIRVNTVSPGPIETSIFTPDKLGLPKEAIESLGSTVLGLVPMKRFGRPEEVAEVVLFLGSERASFVTGAEYTVGGGIEA